MKQGRTFDQGDALRGATAPLGWQGLSFKDIDQSRAAGLQQSIAWICAGLGEKENDRSFAALEHAKLSRDPSMAWLLSSQYLLPLQFDPRWEELKRSMGLAADQLK